MRLSAHLGFHTRVTKPITLTENARPHEPESQAERTAPVGGVQRFGYTLCIKDSGVRFSAYPMVLTCIKTILFSFLLS
jgi:hypothetical protein